MKINSVSGRKEATDAIFIVRQIQEKAKERGVNVHFNFVDFKSAFDTVWREALWKMLMAVGVPLRIVNTVKKMYEDTQCAVVVNGKLTEWFQVTIGVRQGCLLSPTLFNLFLDFLMKELKCLQDEITLNEDLCCDIRYANDTILISATFELLQLSTSQLENACRKYGLKINGDKCKILSQDGKDVTIDSTVVEKVAQFNFLGSTIPGTTTDVEKRLAMAYASFGRLSRNVWTNRNFSTKLKLRLLYALIYPIATYACSTWTLTKKDTNKLRVFENNCLRKILGIKLIDRVPIQKLHEKAGSLPVIVNHVKNKGYNGLGMS